MPVALLRRLIAADAPRRPRKAALALESLEGRKLLSRGAGALPGAPAEVRRHDDGPLHDANDDRLTVTPRRHGADDPATHDRMDDRAADTRRGGTATQARRRGADDPAGHSAHDDRGGLRVRGARGRGADDGAGHHAKDDRGGRRPR